MKVRTLEVAVLDIRIAADDRFDMDRMRAFVGVLRAFVFVGDRIADEVRVATVVAILDLVRGVDVDVRAFDVADAAALVLRDRMDPDEPDLPAEVMMFVRSQRRGRCREREHDQNRGSSHGL